MSKYHIFGAFIMLAAWSGNVSTFNSANDPANSALDALSSDASSRHLISWQVGSAAQAEVRWTPNPERGSASTTMSGGRRGTASSACALDAEVPDPAITLLVPEGSTGLTTKAQPTLSWYLESDNMVDMEFVLSHPESPQPVYTKRLQSEAGLVEVTLPDSVALEADTRYRWTVFVTCNGGEYEIHARSFVERVVDSEVEVAVASMVPSDQAIAYAARGIWYDALNTLVDSYRQESRMVTLLEIRNLLQQADTQVPLELSLAIESQR
ncbi:MAG: DUF928 domain-containing protein [Cyanobacteria bacterium J06623_5]